MRAEGPIDKPPLTPPHDQPPDYSAVNELMASPIESTLLLRHQTLDLTEKETPRLDDTSRIQEQITAAGLQPVVNGTNVRDYRNQIAGATAWETTPLKSDLLVVQYYDGSKQVGGNNDDRSLKYWEAITTAQPSTLTDPSRLEAVRDRAALMNEWGARNMCQIALIPAGTEVPFISRPASPQVEQEYPKSSDHPTGGPTAGALIEQIEGLDALTPPMPSMALPEILKPDQILYAMADVRLGGGPELLFAEFDEAWIVGRGSVGP